jgi:hypothetical protein
MLKINFDLFYELKQGSVVSHTNGDIVKHWQVKNGNLEVKTIVANELENDWQVSDLLVITINSQSQIWRSFMRNSNIIIMGSFCLNLRIFRAF